MESYFVANDAEDTHCVQACYANVVGRLTGKRLTPEAAERDTGYEPELLTWQFKLLLALSQEHNLHVTDHEAFDVRDFVGDPHQSLRTQMNDDVAFEYQVEHSDLSLEAERARECLKDQNIQFVNGAPSVEDLRKYLDEPDTVIVTLINGARLLGQDGYRPHSVVLHGMTAETVNLDDPGPPAHPDWSVPLDDFSAAWLDPSDGVANAIVVRGGRRSDAG